MEYQKQRGSSPRGGTAGKPAMGSAEASARSIQRIAAQRMEAKKPLIFGRRFQSCGVCGNRGEITDRRSHLYLSWHHAIVPRSIIQKLAANDPAIWLFFMEAEENCQLVHERGCHAFAPTRRSALVWAWITYRRFHGGVEAVQRFVCEAQMKGFRFDFSVEMPDDIEIKQVTSELARRSSERQRKSIHRDGEDLRRIRVRHGFLVDKKFLEGLSPSESNELQQINRAIDSAEEGCL